MPQSSLMVIDPSITHPEVSSYNKISECCPLSSTYHLPIISDINSMSRSLHNSCGIIILGSGASVNNKTEWQSILTDIIDQALLKDIPILGICYGHQLLANHLGGKVGYLWNQEKKSGVRDVKIKSNSLARSTQFFPLIYSHQEGVIECPDVFEVIASSEMVKVEGIEHKNKAIWGFQPHIEASWSFANRQGISKNKYLEVEKYGDLIMHTFFKKL